MGLVTIHTKDSNETLYPISHNWLMLIKLCLNPLTYRTFSINIEGVIWILPILIIYPLPLSPKVTTPPSLIFRVTN